MARKPYVVVQEGPDGPHVQIRASNGRIVFSSEVYQNKRNVGRAIELLLALDNSTPVLRKNRDGRTTKDLTVSGYEE